MKFSEMPYTRPDLEGLKAKTAEVVEKLTKAQTAQEHWHLPLAVVGSLLSPREEA